MAFVPFVETDQPTMAAFNEKFQQNYDAVLDDGPKVVLGNYSGSGAYGMSNAKTLTFPFVPKIVFIGSRTQGAYQAMLIQGRTNSIAFHADGNGGNYFVIVSWEGNTVSFYGTISADMQLNGSGKYYDYVAIG